MDGKAVAFDSHGHALIEIDEAAERRLRWKIDLHVVPIVAFMYSTSASVALIADLGSVVLPRPHECESRRAIPSTDMHRSVTPARPSSRRSLA